MNDKKMKRAIEGVGFSGSTNRVGRLKDDHLEVKIVPRARSVIALSAIAFFGLLGRAGAVERLDAKPAAGWWSKARQECVELVLQSGTDLNHRDEDGDTPLIAAARLGWYAVVQAMLEAGADYRLRNHIGRGVLSDIVESASLAGGDVNESREKVIEWLVDKGADFRDAEYWAQRRDDGQLIFGRWCLEHRNRTDHWVNIEPRTARDYRLRGAGHHWRLHEDDLAIADFTEAIRLEPLNAANYEFRGSTWLDRHAAADVKRDDLDHAIADLTEAVRLDPRRTAAFAERAWAWSYKNDHDKVIADYDALLALDPRDVRAYDGRGQAWHAKRELDKAIADFDKAININGEFSDAYLHRGGAFSSLSSKLNGWNWRNEVPKGAGKQEYERAMADYSRAIKHDPRNAQAYESRAGLWSRAREFDKAIADYTAAIEIDPTNVQYYLSRGGTFAESGDQDRAINDFTKGLTLRPPAIFGGYLYRERAEAWLAKKQYDRAFADYDAAVALSPNLNFFRRRAWTAAGRIDKLVDELKGKIKQDPTDVSSHKELASVFTSSPDAAYRDGRAGLACAIRACDLTEWKSAYPLTLLAAAHAELGNFAEAVNWQARAVEIEEHPKTKARYQERLLLYEKGETYREERP